MALVACTLLWISGYREHTESLALVNNSPQGPQGAAQQDSAETVSWSIYSRSRTYIKCILKGLEGGNEFIIKFISKRFSNKGTSPEMYVKINLYITNSNEKVAVQLLREANSSVAFVAYLYSVTV